MTILVVNCNHWIGFHITKTLLEEDFCIDGIIDASIDNDLTMFFGRNSNFNVITKSNKEYDASIIIGEFEQIHTLESRKKIVIETDKRLKSLDKYTTIVRPPLLFGEWMPMEDTGCYQGSKFIPFDSEVFRNQALSINIFSSLLLQWMSASELPNFLEVNPVKAPQKNSVCVRKGGDTEKQLEILKRHYKKYRNFYQ